MPLSEGGEDKPVIRWEGIVPCNPLCERSSDHKTEVKAEGTEPMRRLARRVSTRRFGLLLKKEGQSGW